MLYKCKGDFRSLDHNRDICLLSMISRVLARLAISRCSKHFENLGIMVNEQWGFRRESAMERAGTWERNAPSAPRQPMWDLLKRNGLPPRILAVFQRFHGETSYSVRLRSGDPGVYMRKRGLREGCASSCKLNRSDAWNTLEMLALIALQRENERRPKRCTARGRKHCDACTLWILRDDTTTIFPAPKLANVREQVKTVLGDREEDCAPGKRRVHDDRNVQTEREFAGHHHHVRMLGAWIDTDGGALMDTTMRISAAAKVWSKLRKPLINSGLPLKEQGYVFMSACSRTDASDTWCTPSEELVSDK